MGKCLFSYVVRYDSGFAPNPFGGYCTLATCKPDIRKHASVGDWIVGTGSDMVGIRRGKYLVYAMKVTEILQTKQYWHDARFQVKKPDLFYNWVAASGDNIYEPVGTSEWNQLDSYHSKRDGSPCLEHIERDTRVPKVLVSNCYVYFGGEGPKLPQSFMQEGPMELCRPGIRKYIRVRNEKVIGKFVNWLETLHCSGYCGKPWDWILHRRRRA